MLRPHKFRPLENRILQAIALLLTASAVFGIAFAVRRADGRLFIASIGVLVIAAIYVAAAKRGKPL